MQNTVPCRRHDRLSVATCPAGQWQTAHFGASDALAYELGSVTSTFTASLVALAIERGEVTAQIRVGGIVGPWQQPRGTTPPVITSHNGMTGGFASFVGFHRERAGRRRVEQYGREC